MAEKSPVAFWIELKARHQILTLRGLAEVDGATCAQPGRRIYAPVGENIGAGRQLCLGVQCLLEVRCCLRKLQCRRQRTGGEGVGSVEQGQGAVALTLQRHQVAVGIGDEG